MKKLVIFFLILAAVLLVVFVWRQKADLPSKMPVIEQETQPETPVREWPAEPGRDKG